MLKVGDAVLFTIKNGEIHVTWLGFGLFFLLLLIVLDAIRDIGKKG
jgi:hypothetical protein